MSDKIFLKTTFLKFIALFNTLLLAPFECKSVDYLSHSECFKNIRGISAAFSFEKDEIANFLESLKTHFNSNIWAIGTQKVPKEAHWIGLYFFKEFVPKIFVWREQEVVKNSSITYVWYTLDVLIWFKEYDLSADFFRFMDGWLTTLLYTCQGLFKDEQESSSKFF